MIAYRLHRALMRAAARLDWPDPRPVDDRLGDVDKARRQTLDAAARLARAYDNHDEHPGESHIDDEIDYSHDLLAEAARDLVAATDALPRDLQPVGWRAGVGA